MKKILTLLMVMALIMTGFTACGSGNEGEAGGNAAGSVEGTPAEIFTNPKQPRTREFLSRVISRQL